LNYLLIGVVIDGEAIL